MRQALQVHWVDELLGRGRPGVRPLIGSGDLRRALWAAGTVALALALFRNRYFLTDDAYVSLRYAANLISHGELAWNLGERVEGFTNLLHLLVTAGLGALGVDLVVAVHLVNAVSAVVLIAAVLRCATLLAPDSPLARAIGGALLLGSHQLALWVWGGLEGVMVAALVTAAHVPLLTQLLHRDRPDARLLLLAGGLFGLAVATRPDTALLAAAAGAALLLVEAWPMAQRLRALLLLGLVPAAIALALTAWRLRYYGDVVPNTFYAKMAFDAAFRLARGMRYIALALLQMPLLGFVLLALGSAQDRTLRPPTILLLAGGGTYLLYVWWVGGDYMVGNRMVVPVLGLAALLAVDLMARLEEALLRSWAVAALLVICGLGLLAPVERTEPGAFVGEIVGRHIAAHWPKDAVVAVNCVGATPYFAPEHRFVDMLGLNDRTIAKREIEHLRLPTQSWPGHAKGDGAYVLQRQPDYVIPGPADGLSVASPWFLTDLELAEQEGFQRCYVLETVEVPYDPALLARAKRQRPNPLLLTYYRRICDPGAPRQTPAQAPAKAKRGS